MVIAEVSVIPIGTKTPSVSKYITRATEVLRLEKDVNYELTAMGTLIEGELENVLRVISKMHNSLFNQEVKRVITTIKIDDRRDKKLTMDYKVGSVMKRIKDK